MAVEMHSRRWSVHTDVQSPWTSCCGDACAHASCLDGFYGWSMSRRRIGLSRIGVGYSAVPMPTRSLCLIPSDGRGSSRAGQRSCRQGPSGDLRHHAPLVDEASRRHHGLSGG